jgi:hypothetical protein
MKDGDVLPVFRRVLCFFPFLWYNKMKIKNWHIVRTIPYFNRKALETEEKSVPLTHIYITAQKSVPLTHIIITAQKSVSLTQLYITANYAGLVQ